MSRVGAVGAAAVLAALWFGPIAAAEPTPPPSSTQDIPISIENTTMPMADPDTIDHLASTGADVTGMLRTGIALVAAGVLAVAVTRRPGGAA